MKTFLYLAAGLLSAPGIAFACFVGAVGGLSRQKDLWAGLRYILVNAVRMLEWGIYLVAALILLWLALALVPKYRFIGALAMGVATVASIIQFFVAGGPPRSFDELFLPLLSLAGLLLNLWIAWEK